MELEQINHLSHKGTWRRMELEQINKPVSQGNLEKDGTGTNKPTCLIREPGEGWNWNK
jgi:hypothetical protein